MRKLLLQLFVIIGIGLAAAASGDGQISQPYRFKIPFDFTVSNTMMAAGNFWLAPLEIQSCSRPIIIRNLDNGRTRILGFPMCEVGTANFDQKATLTFWRSGNNYALLKAETPTFAVTMKKVWTDVKVLSDSGQRPEIVTVASQ